MLKFKASNNEDRGLIDMAFNKKKADDRKEWLRGFVVGHITFCYRNTCLMFVQLAGNLSRPIDQGGSHSRLHQQRTHPFLDGRQSTIHPFRCRRLQAWSA